MPLCPACHIPLITERDEAPWCERCEHNLDHFATDDAEVWTWAGLYSQRQGFEADRELGRAAPGQSGEAAPGLMALQIISVLIYGLGAFLLIYGIWLLSSAANAALGLLLAALSLLLLPRLGRVRSATRDAYVTTATSRPVFFDLLGRVAMASGAPMPHIVGFSRDWNAFTTVAGFRRKRILIVGIPLWAALTPQERVALLSHELGHFVNSDSNRAILTRPALTQFGRVGRFLQAIFVLGSGNIYMAPWRVAVSLVGTGFWTIHLSLNVLGSAQNRRDELRADLVAAQVAGTKATTSVLDVLACSPELLPHLSVHAAEGEVLKTWHEGVQWARSKLGDRIARLRQLSNRDEASVFASHPAPGRRHQFLSQLAYRDPALVLAEAEAHQIDRELNPYAEKFRAESYELTHGI